MVSARRPQSHVVPFLLVVAGALGVVGILAGGGHEPWMAVPLASVVLGTWLLLQPGPRHLDTAAPIGDLDQCRLSLVAGGAELQVRSHDLGGDLYRASLTARDGMPRASVDAEHGRVSVAMPRPWWRSVLPQPYPTRAVLALSTRVRWTLDLRAEAFGGRVDLTDAPLDALVVAAGGGELQLDLPRPHGTVPVRLNSSRVHAVVTLPDGVPVQLICEPGTWHVEVPRDNGPAVQHRAPRVVEVGADGHDRYDVTLEGAGRLRLERR